MYICKCQTTVGYSIEKVFDVKEYNYNRIDWDKYKCKKYITYMTFDIETSRYQKTIETYETFMYIWQVCINNDVIFGRTWQEFIDFINQLKIENQTDKKIVCYVHNLAYEFQFMKDFFKWTSIFSIDEHVVLKCVHDNIEFRCSYKLSNMSLEKFIENTPNHYFIKGVGDLDYSVLRTPQTELTQVELGYCYNDVRGLYHCINHLLEDDTLDTIPLTSTGYVRRECRKACRNDNDRKVFKKSKLNLKVYNLLKECFRGGNTASSRFHTNQIINNVNSYDISSSYPYVMMTEMYPVGKFMNATIEDESELDYYNRKYCTIARYSFTNVRLKRKNTPIPYLSYSKCTRIDKDALCYNGRVMSAKFISTSLTNIDFDIFQSMYDYDEIYVDDFFFSRKKLLSKELRKTILKYFEDKTLLKGNVDMYYFYMKQKNKLNSIYGMFVSSIVRDQYDFDEKENLIKKKEDNDAKSQLDEYYKSRNSFLSYQCGVWVTAYARKRLQELIDIIGIDVVYCDTDSVKYIGNYDVEIKKINKQVIENSKSVDVPFNVGRVYMGVWEHEKPYDEFITMGAKKYAYLRKGKLGVTVSGLNKKNAPIELEKKGGLKEFKRGTVFSNSGRVTVEYHHDKIHNLKINNEIIVTGSYINMFDTTYTLGISDTMLNIINDSLLK